MKVSFQTSEKFKGDSFLESPFKLGGITSLLLKPIDTVPGI
jgi:hypothetical protein